MRREELGAGGLALLLLAAAAALAVPFRAEALRRSGVLSVSWDAALHGLSGLDLFDDLRLLRLLDALGDVLSQHWWGPAFGVVLAPCFALFGRTLASATLPSFFAYVLAAPAVFLAGRRSLGALPAFETVALAALVGAFMLRAPMLLETSAWIMLESLGGLLAVASLGLLAARGRAVPRRTAFALAAALFLLKYHVGVFALVTAGVAAWIGEDREARGRFTAALRAAVPGRGAAVFAAVAGLLAAGRLALEARGGDALARRLPSVPNVAWGTLVAALLLVATRRARFREAWRAAPETLRDFMLFGLVAPAAWCLDPANVRAWYRQLFQPTDAPVTNPLSQVGAYLGFLRADYAPGPFPFGLALLGLALALALRGSAGRRTLAAFAVWPVLLMSLNRYPAEARFVACLAPALFAASSAGLVAAARRLPQPAGRAALLALVAALAVSLEVGEDAWRREADRRATYRYPYDAAGEAAAARAIGRAPRTGPVELVLPEDPPVWPTVRLALRLERPGVAPRDVVVETRPGAPPP